MISVPQSHLIITFVEEGMQGCMMGIGGRWLERRLPGVVSEIGQGNMSFTEANGHFALDGTTIQIRADGL